MSVDYPLEKERWKKEGEGEEGGKGLKDSGRKRRPTSSVGVLMTREEEGEGGERSGEPLTGYRSLPSPQMSAGMKVKKKLSKEKKRKEKEEREKEKEREREREREREKEVVEKKRSHGEIKKKLPKAR